MVYGLIYSQRLVVMYNRTENNTIDPRSEILGDSVLIVGSDNFILKDKYLYPSQKSVR